MLFYTSSIPITIRTTSQVKHIEATLDQNNLNPEHIYSLGRADWEYLENHIKEKQLKIEEVITLRDDSAFSLWEHMPMFLGRKDPNFVSLIDQLEKLKAKHPARTKFTIAINNGFGSSLGDSLIGITAFRHVYPIIKSILGDVQIHILMGWIHNESVMELYKQVPEFDLIVEENVNLAELSKYQAIIDFYGLLKIPRYGTMPVVDWYMWWMGLDSDTISNDAKRNRIYTSLDDLNTVKLALNEFSGKTILFNQRTSVNLRSMPEKFATRLIQYLLKQFPFDRIVILQSLDIKHPRLLDFSTKTPTLDSLAALVNCVDLVITPDTYLLHLADAVNTPCVALYSSVSPSRYPYYPRNIGLLIPGAEQLSAWDKSKVSEEEWSNISSEYESAWDSLYFDDIRRSIDRLFTLETNVNNSLRDLNTRQCNNFVFNKNWFGRGFTSVALTEHIEQLINLFTLKYLTYGDSVVYMGSGFTESVNNIANVIGHLGTIHIIEPRQQIHQITCANLITNQFANAKTYCVLPFDTTGEVLTIQSLDIKNEYNTISSNNCVVSENVITMKLDDLNINHCRMLIITKPIDVARAINGSINTITKLSPVILILCKTSEFVDGLSKLFDSIHYSTQSYPVDNSGEYSLFLGVKSK